MIKLCFIQDITVAYLAERSSLSDGVIRLPSAGVPCPHCGSNKTTGRLLGNVIVGIKKLFNK